MNCVEIESKSTLTSMIWKCLKFNDTQLLIYSFILFAIRKYLTKNV